MNKQSNLELSLFAKMKIVLEAVREIEAAKNETEASQLAVLYMEKLQYPHIMFSWLQEIDGELFVVGDPYLAMGDKWKEIAAKTKRPYDKPTDLLPLVLRKAKARFMLDARNDDECDRYLCKEMGIVSLYAMPLATDSMKIGTLQVDMGECEREPAVELEILDAFSAHLSLAIERHRVLRMLERVNNELTSQTRIITFEAAAAKIIHELNSSMGDYCKRLREKIGDVEIRSNKAAVDFLKFTQKQITRWVNSVQANINKVKRNEEEGNYQVEEIVKEVVGNFQHKAAAQNKKLRGIYKALDATVNIRRGSLLELLSCLIMNSFEAEAQEIDVTVRKMNKVGLSDGAEPHVQIVVSDDGCGIPEEFESQIYSFGWSSKDKCGHGMGLTIVQLLAKSMEGKVRLEARGRSSGQAKTRFVVEIPVV